MLDKKEELGQLIRTMRLSRNMTQSDLAKKIGQSQSSITMYETGRREPDFETMEALADAFNVPLHTLFPNDSDHASNESYIRIKYDETRTLATGFEKMPKEKREKLIAFARDYFSQYFDENDEKGRAADDENP